MRIPAILRQRRYIICQLFVDADTDFPDEAAAVAEQHPPEVLDRRLFVEQLRLVEAPRNCNALLASVRVLIELQQYFYNFTKFSQKQIPRIDCVDLDVFIPV